MARARSWLLVLLIACTPHHANAPARVPAAGISIALYDGGADNAYGVVDDRRWVDVSSGTNELVIEHVDPGADLASLVIEPLGRDAVLQVGECERARLPTIAAVPTTQRRTMTIIDENISNISTAHLEGRHLRVHQVMTEVQVPPPEVAAQLDVTVRCVVTARPGRYLIRILYVAPSLRYRAQHDVDVVAADRARLTTRFAITTPAWHDRADVTIFDGIPGGDQPPRQVARGTALLDGSIAVVAVPAREVPARIRRVYDGAVPTPELPAADAAWNGQSIQNVWVWLELPGVRLAPGPVRVHLDLPAEGVGDVDVAQTARKQDERPDAPLRLPLWTDTALRGGRQRFGDPGDGAALAERVMFSVANLGDTQREVWIEEHVRPARTRRVEGAWPQKPASSGDLLRSKLEIKPHRIERAGYTIAYDF